MAFLKPDKVRTEHGLVIKEKVIPWGAKWTKAWKGYKAGSKYKADKLLSNGTGKVKKITVHNTDDIQEAKGTNDAEQYSRATWTQNMGDARVHYFIDETDCWQLLREDEVGWHAGDGVGPGNETSLAIEIIMDGSGSAADVQAENRGALLAAILLDRHGLGIDDMVPHKHWSGKNCPLYILPHWSQFVAKVKRHLDAFRVEPEKPKTEAVVIYRVQAGAYSKRAGAEDLLQRIKAKGFDAIIVKIDGLFKVQVGAYGKKNNAKAKRDELIAAGFQAFVTTKGGAAVAPAKKSIKEVAKEVIAGKWGNGSERKKKLEAAGYDYDAVQAQVNKLL